VRGSGSTTSRPRNSAAGLAATETLRQAPGSGRLGFFPQAAITRAVLTRPGLWGLTHTPSRERATPYTVTHEPLVSAETPALRPVDPHQGALASSSAANDPRPRGSRRADHLTIFSPLMVPLLVRGDRACAGALVLDAAAVERGLHAIAETPPRTRACLQPARTVSSTPPTWRRARSSAPTRSGASAAFDRIVLAAVERAVQPPPCALKTSGSRSSRLSRHRVQLVLAPGNPS
jgi:hypothetical protein